MKKYERIAGRKKNFLKNFAYLICFNKEVKNKALEKSCLFYNISAIILNLFQSETDTQIVRLPGLIIHSDT